MNVLTRTLCAMVALLHLGFLLLEMFFWNHPVGHRVFAMSPEVAASSQVLAMNQGLYNGFLAAGLIWGLMARRNDVLCFFLVCVSLAGVFGAITAKPSIFFIQALPALLALGALALGSRGPGSPR